ncbi:MAG: hypothetical protein IJA78_04505 [Clostridia bacterium]|nr:hypothetical protein [Clostridia bacterium]
MQFRNAPYRRHWTSQKTPVETATLFERPDEVVLIQGGWVKWLDAENIPALYEEIVWFETASSQIVPTLAAPTSDTRDAHRSESFCVELRYDRRHKYVGEIAAFCGEEYDALLLAFDERHGVFVMPYCGVEYSGGNVALVYENNYMSQYAKREYLDRVAALKRFNGAKCSDPIPLKKEAG